MGLMDCIGIFVDQLVQDRLDAVIVLLGDKLADDAFEPGKC